MCVNKQLLKFVFDSIYVDMQYDEIYLTFIAGYVGLCGVCKSCGSPWSVCEVLWCPQLFCLVQVMCLR